ncbi:MAG: hypothetical protein XD95_0030 [Microgenomates bacterium 39_7]|nr:MAG: hypothetical protein XD95_0030 [Microgenomates bacterium 39_7]
MPPSTEISSAIDPRNKHSEDRRGCTLAVWFASIGYLYQLFTNKELRSRMLDEMAKNQDQESKK